MAELLTIQTRYTLQTPETRNCHVILAGCGGTGSFIALHLARLAYHLHDRDGTRLRITFVDPDSVESKNLGRQNFAPAEVGRNKAEALAWRYNMTFGLDIDVVPERFDPAGSYFRDNESIFALDWFLLIGAVDNPDGRQALAGAVKYEVRRRWWLDCGNHEHAGQVLLGNRDDLTAPEISELGFCGALPSPAVQAPEILEPAPPTPITESCAELTLRDAQSLMINQAMATYAAQYVYRMLVTHDLDVYATYVDLLTGSARSVPIADTVSTN